MRFYRALLRLYPASFRAEYSAELERTFQQLVRDRGAAGAAAAAVADVLPNALTIHWELLRQDLRHALRALRRAPGFAATAILVVALGVGANTAAFSLADFIFLRPFPFADPERLVKLYERDARNERSYGDMSPANFRDWKSAQRSFSAMGAYTFRSANLVSRSEPRRIEIVRTTPDVLPLLGVFPARGRLFAPEDTASGQAIVLSHGLWQSQFGGDPGIVGSHVRLDGIPHAVVGVMPPSFRFPAPGIEAWAPLVLTEDSFADRSDRFLFGIARLRPGVTRMQARAELDRIAAALEMQHPEENRNVRAAVFTLRGEIADRSRILVIALCGAAACILLLACANLASLVLARGSHRAREIAVRAALGAGRERLVRQLVTESLILAVAGGVVGIAVAASGIPLLAALVPGGLPTAAQPSLNTRVLALAALLMLVTVVAFGLAPALRIGGRSGLDALRGGARAGGGRTQRVRAALVVMEIAASVVLLIASGLLIRAVWRAGAVDPGFRSEDVLTLRTALPLPKYDSTARRMQYYDHVLGEVRALPGVESAAFATGLPLVMRGGIWPVGFPGRERARDGSEMVSLRFVTPQYFATLGIPLLRGRDFADTDRREAPAVAIVSESFAERHWPGEDPIGKTLTLADSIRTVVGVVGDVRVRGLEREGEPQLYLHPAQVPDGAIIGYIPKEMVVRAAVDPATLVSGIRDIVRGADPEQPVSHVRPLADIVAAEMAPRLTQVRILGALSVIALLIAGLGIYGLLTFTVAMRSQELGIRRALGAQVSGIVGFVMREGLLLCVAGIAIGVPVAWAAARWMSAALFGVSPADPATMLAAVLLCLVTAIAGCLRPALRAGRIDPITALRAD